MGIAVEFCSHILHSFERSSKGTAQERAEDALANMGISVSNILEVYFWVEHTSPVSWCKHNKASVVISERTALPLMI